jgi:hypothetical protein
MAELLIAFEAIRDPKLSSDGSISFEQCSELDQNYKENSIEESRTTHDELRANQGRGLELCDRDI